MQYNEEEEMYLLSSGREFYANLGILGLGPDGELMEGYDGGVDEDGSWFPKENRFTREERTEIAELMIQRWQEWGNR